MKKLICVLFILYTSNLFSQKEDYFWTFGLGIGGTAMSSLNFVNQPPIVTNYIGVEAFFERNIACISDSSGNFLFATNGMLVVDKMLDTMQNGTGLNLNGISVQDLAPKCSIILPPTNNTQEYYLIYHLISITGYPYKLLYAKIDMSLNGGKGAVVQKNIPIIIDDLGWESLQAVRHANGKDWWLLCPKRNSTLIYRILYSPSGFQNMGTQNVSYATNHTIRSIFTPDGNKLVQHFAEENKIRIHSFDRCTGLLKSYIDISDNAGALTGPQGLSISSNSQYLYINNSDTLFQYNLLSSDIESSKLIVGISDHFNSQGVGNQYFHISQLAPDKKIYISSGIDYIHVINNPDSVGLACNFVQRQIHVQAFVDGLPNFPNYRLGHDIGSACDTVFVSNQVSVSSKQVEVYPNPTTDKLHISVAGIKEPLTILLLNTLGQEVARYALAQEEQEISLTNLSKGVYYCQVLGREGVYFAAKVIKE